jgi:S1-C subfamily serine protease
LEGTVAASPAERAGLKEGDVITSMNGKPIKELRDLSNVLKGLTAGDKVTIELLREGEKLTLDAVLQER